MNTEFGNDIEIRITQPVQFIASRRDEISRRIGAFVCQCFPAFKRITRYFGDFGNQPGYSEYTAKFEERAELAKSEQDPVDRARQMIDNNQLCVGDPDTCIKVTAEYQRIGLDQMMGIIQYSDITHEESMESLRLMGKHVIPRFKD